MARTFKGRVEREGKRFIVETPNGETIRVSSYKEAEKLISKNRTARFGGREIQEL